METSSARAAIFARIRKAQQRAPTAQQSELDQVQDYLAHHESGPRPDLGHDLVQRFREQDLRTSQTLDEVATLADVHHAFYSKLGKAIVFFKQSNCIKSCSKRLVNF
jgi:L-lactate dehydrogenase complex protein LldG